MNEEMEGLSSEKGALAEEAYNFKMLKEASDIVANRSMMLITKEHMRCALVILEENCPDLFEPEEISVEEIPALAGTRDQLNGLTNVRAF